MDSKTETLEARTPYSNFTAMDNNIWDNMSKFSPVEFMVYCFIHRKIYGWKNNRMDLSDKISTSQIIEGTGLSKNSVLRSIKSLQEKELIKKENTLGIQGMKGINLITLIHKNPSKERNANNESSSKGRKTEESSSKGRKTDLGSASKGHTKETVSTKETKNKETKGPACEILDYLNLKADKNHGYTEINLQGIKARFKDGANKDDCKYVIDVCTALWKDKENGNFIGNNALNPITLFRKSNFPKYLSWQMPNTKRELTAEELQAEADYVNGITTRDIKVEVVDDCQLLTN